MLVVTLYLQQLDGLSRWRTFHQMRQVVSSYANAAYTDQVIIHPQSKTTLESLTERCNIAFLLLPKYFENYWKWPFHRETGSCREDGIIRMEFYPGVKRQRWGKVCGDYHHLTVWVWIISCRYFLDLCLFHEKLKRGVEERKSIATSQDVRKVRLLRFYNLINASATAARMKGRKWEANGNNHTATVDKSHCLWLGKLSCVTGHAVCGSTRAGGCRGQLSFDCPRSERSPPAPQKTGRRTEHEVTGRPRGGL